jgi:hypothetical protein
MRETLALPRSPTAIDAPTDGPSQARAAIPNQARHPRRPIVASIARVEDPLLLLAGQPPRPALSQPSPAPRPAAWQMWLALHEAIVRARGSETPGARPEHQPARGTDPLMLFRAARVPAWHLPCNAASGDAVAPGGESELLGGANDVADAGVPQRQPTRVDPRSCSRGTRRLAGCARQTGPRPLSLDPPQR